MAALQKSTQDSSAALGASLDTVGTLIESVSANVDDLHTRFGKFDQKLADVQNTLQAARLTAPVH